VSLADAWVIFLLAKGEGMKKTKMNWLIAIFLIFMVVGLIACGSGGNADTSAPAPTPTPTPNPPPPTPPPTPTTPSIKVDGFVAIPDDQYTESIVMVMNENFASSHSNWQTIAQVMLDEENTALNRTAGNKKQYVIGRFMTLLDANVVTMYENGPDSSFYLDNGFTRCGGTTVFFYLYDGIANKPSFESGGLHHVRSSSDGRILEEVWISYDIASSPFTNLVQGTLAYDIESNALRHELGHTAGLAAEEWYRYQFQDFTGVLPNLGAYSRQVQFPADPMDSGVGVGVLTEFAPFNSWLININANHQYNLKEVIEGVPAILKVKVVDSANNPISGATVQVFAALWGSVAANGGLISDIPVTSSIPLLNGLTDANGEFLINSDDTITSTHEGVTLPHKFSTGLSAKIIKVASGGKVAGTFLTLTDLEKAYLQDGLDTLVITLKPE
jgi:hypothetical protein